MSDERGRQSERQRAGERQLQVSHAEGGVLPADVVDDAPLMAVEVATNAQQLAVGPSSVWRGGAGTKTVRFAAGAWRRGWSGASIVVTGSDGRAENVRGMPCLLCSVSAARTLL
ncbi:hypothetical protein GCM10020000_84370 [Streptomyces olivoverticillatus]